MVHYWVWRWPYAYRETSYRNQWHYLCVLAGSAADNSGIWCAFEEGKKEERRDMAQDIVFFATGQTCQDLEGNL